MNDRRRMNIFKTHQHLIKKGLYMFSRKVLGGHDELVEIRIHVCRNKKEEKTGQSDGYFFRRREIRECHSHSNTRYKS